MAMSDPARVISPRVITHPVGRVAWPSPRLHGTQPRKPERRHKRRLPAAPAGLRLVRSARRGGHGPRGPPEGVEPSRSRTAGDGDPLGCPPSVRPVGPRERATSAAVSAPHAGREATRAAPQGRRAGRHAVRTGGVLSGPLAAVCRREVVRWAVSPRRPVWAAEGPGRGGCLRRPGRSRSGPPRWSRVVPRAALGPSPAGALTLPRPGRVRRVRGVSVGAIPAPLVAGARCPPSLVGGRVRPTVRRRAAAASARGVARREPPRRVVRCRSSPLSLVSCGNTHFQSVASCLTTTTGAKTADSAPRDASTGRATRYFVSKKYEKQRTIRSPPHPRAARSGPLPATLHPSGPTLPPARRLNPRPPTAPTTDSPGHPAREPLLSRRGVITGPRTRVCRTLTPGESGPEGGSALTPGRRPGLGSASGSRGAAGPGR